MEQMRDLVPAALRSPPRALRRSLVAVLDDARPPCVTLVLQDRRGRTDLGRYRLGDNELGDAASRLPARLRRSAVLVVRPDRVLQRDIVLPLAAEQDLQNVLTYEMDRLTPFRADEVLWTGRVQTRDKARNRLLVRLSIMPRGWAQPILDDLRGAEIIPARIEAAAAAGLCRTIELRAAQPRRGALERHADAAALGLCGILAAAALGLPFVLQARARATTEMEIEALQPKVAEVEQLRRRIANGINTADALAAAKEQVGPPLRALALLTAALPDDTYITMLAVHQRKLTVNGFSAGAARLIGSLSADPLIHNPAFTGPVTRDEASGTELFSLGAELRP